MTRKVAILIATPPGASVPTRIAVAVFALSKLSWSRWKPSLHVFTSDRHIAKVIQEWWRNRGEAITVAVHAPASQSAVCAPTDALFRTFERGASVYIKLAPDALAVDNFEDLLDRVDTARCVAGVIAPYGFAALPGLPPRDAWQRLAEGLIDKPPEFAHLHPLVDPGVPGAEASTPFYVSTGTVFFSGSIFPELAEHYLGLKPFVLDRLPIRSFADSVAISLAAIKMGAPTVALPLRYNFPNDETAATRFPAELQDVRIFQHIRTDDIAENAFADAAQYATFLESRLTGANAVFRTRVEAIIGSKYPFRRVPHNAGAPTPPMRSEPPAEVDRSSAQAMTSLGAPESKTGSVTGCRYFDYAKGRPNLYLLMRFKQALVAELGVRHGFFVFRQTVSLRDCDQLLLEPLASERAVAEVHAHSFCETAPAGERFVLDPPAVIGAGNHRRLEGVTRSFYVACFDGARIRGRSAIIETCDLALLDYQGSEPSQIDDEIEWDPAIFHATQDMAWIIAPGNEAASIKLETAFTLTGAHTDFFGHWMCEYLPKYVAAVLSGVLPSVPVLIDANMPASHRQALEFLFAEQIELIELAAFKTAFVRRLWCAPSLMYMPLHEKRNEHFDWQTVAASPERFAPVIQEMARRADLALGAPTGCERIFLARRDFRHRKMTNRMSIEAIAKSHGFRVVHPEDLSFPEQVSAVRNAQFLVAPEGSALFLAFFSRAKTKVCILSHPLTDVLADYNGLLGRHGVELTVLTGPITRQHPQTPHDSDYEIDEGVFCRFIDQWLM